LAFGQGGHPRGAPLQQAAVAGYYYAY
jgi:hypothetical protein